jgi:hypothetical protein
MSAGSTRESYVWSVTELRKLAQLDVTLPFDEEDWVPLIRHALTEAQHRLQSGHFTIPEQDMQTVVHQLRGWQ